MYKIFFILNCLCAFAFSSQLRDDIDFFPNSLAKDFLIYLYLDKNSTTKNDALQIKDKVYKLSPKLKVLFDKKIDLKRYEYEKKCKNLNARELLNAQNECAIKSVNPNFINTLPLHVRKQIYEKLKNDYNLSWLNALNQKDVFLALNEDDFLKLFFQTSDEFILQNLDKTLSKNFILALQKKANYAKFIQKIAQKKVFKNLQNSLLQNQNIKKDDFFSNFYLALSALNVDNEKKASEFLNFALTFAQTKYQVDMSNFWLYLVTKDENYLQTLSESEDFNFYAFYAKQKLDKNHFKIDTFNPNKQKLDFFSITDPFIWEFTKLYMQNMNENELKNFAKQFYTKQTLPHFVHIMQKIHKYKKHYFITPYEKFLKNTSYAKKALIYAIARAESKAIPTDISTSYALGMMQFMPFLAYDSAKNLKEFNIYDMFNPKTALTFASLHIDYLQTYLFSPLLVAYAYNGGIGFTRNMLQKSHLFQKGKYEPFLSMELVPYEESKEYGKKVLVNYIVFSQMYGLNFNLEYLLENLQEPFLSYQFP